MVNHLVFHADVDGICTAAFFMRHNFNKDTVYQLHPLLSSYRGERFKKLISELNLTPEDKLYIFDFENHPRADFWVDHHYNAKLGKEFISNKKMIYNPSAPSAVTLYWNSIRQDPGVSSYKSNGDYISGQVDMIDMAIYPDVNFVFTDKSPLMILRAYIETRFPSEMMFSRAVEVLAASDFYLNELALIRLNLDGKYVDQLKQSCMYSKKFLEVYNNISVIRQKNINQFPRYSEIYLMPHLKYNVRASSIDEPGLCQLQVSYNPWHTRTNEVHIGEFLASLDYVNGGGHFNVGGGKMRKDDLDQFLDDFSLATKNEEEPVMEKYAVDKEDKVEKKAQELVKTGAEQTIEEARKKASEEKDGSDVGKGDNIQ